MRRSKATHCGDDFGVPATVPTFSVFVGCCARAVSGHATAAPPRSVMIPALHYWAARLRLEKRDYEVFPTSAGEDKFTRAISMPYGNTFDVLPEQSALAGHGNRQLLEDCLYLAEKMQI